MEPLITSLQNPAGLITIEIHRFKTLYLFNGEKLHSFSALSLKLQEVDPFYTDSDIVALELRIAKLERSIIHVNYTQAIKPKDAQQLLCELSDLGVETTSLRIPCIGDNCDEVAIEDVGNFQRMDEVQSEAEVACEFTEGRCAGCHDKEQQENAEEEMAIALDAEKEDQYNSREGML